MIRFNPRTNSLCQSNTFRLVTKILRKFSLRSQVTKYSVITFFELKCPYDEAYLSIKVLTYLRLYIQNIIKKYINLIYVRFKNNSP